MGVFDGALKTRVQHSHPYEYVRKSIQLPAPGVALNLNNAAAGGTGSLNLAVIGTASGVIASGAEYDGTNSIARAASATQLEFLNNVFNWFADTGLTIGSTYTRTKRMSLDGSGNLKAIGTAHALGLGALGAVGGYVQLVTDSGANVIINAQHGTIADANLVLRTKGNGGIYFQNAAGTVTVMTMDTTATNLVGVTNIAISGTISNNPTFSGTPVFSAGIDLGGWTDYTPTITPGGSMTMTSFGVDPAAFARYKVVGKICFVEINLGFTFGGTLSNSYTVSLPLTAARSGGVMTSTVQNLAGIANITSTTAVTCLFYNQATLGSGNFYVKITGFYELP